MSQFPVIGRDTRSLLFATALELWPGYEGVSKNAMLGGLGDEKARDMLGAIRSYLALEVPRLNKVIAGLRKEHEQAVADGKEAMRKLGIPKWQAEKKAKAFEQDIKAVEKQIEEIGAKKADFLAKLEIALTSDTAFATSRPAAQASQPEAIVQ